MKVLRDGSPKTLEVAVREMPGAENLAKHDSKSNDGDDGTLNGVTVGDLDRATRQIGYGRIPAGSVVIAGTLPAPDASYSTACAVIVKKVDAQTRAKTSINELLRD